jgi:hypothetical protein
VACWIPSGFPDVLVHWASFPLLLFHGQQRFPISQISLPLDGDARPLERFAVRSFERFIQFFELASAYGSLSEESAAFKNGRSIARIHPAAGIIIGGRGKFRSNLTV